MSVISKEIILKDLNRIKDIAISALKKKSYNLALSYWQEAAFIRYFFYLEVIDDEIEGGIASLSQIIKKQDDCFEPLRNRLVFYDTHSIARGGLTLQYLRALFDYDFEMMYITEVPSDSPAFQPILKELQDNSVEIRYVPSDLGWFEKSQYIYDCVMNYRPRYLFTHYSPSNVHSPVAFCALPEQIEKYNINFTDHTYWPGYSVIGNCFEFRQYGCCLSILKRGIKDRNDYLIPFYPIEDNNPFRGFPFNTENKIVVFSGGAYYKTIDNNKTYFKICKQLIDIDPRIVIVYAGFGNYTLMQSNLEEFGLTDHFYLIGLRDDVSAVFDNVDLYLDTYPIRGGLMCQYAARHSVPILSLFSEGKSCVEEFVCQKGYCKITSDDMESFMKRATSLIENEEFRREEGKQMKELCVSVKEFNDAVHTAIVNKQKLFSYQIDNAIIRKTYDTDTQVLMVNKTKSYQRHLVRNLGLRSMFINPSYLMDALYGITKQHCASWRKKKQYGSN